MPPALTQNTRTDAFALFLTRRAWPALLAALLGAVLIYLAGFVQIPEIHNAAHDARHAAGFPCH